MATFRVLGSFREEGGQEPGLPQCPKNPVLKQSGYELPLGCVHSSQIAFYM